MPDPDTDISSASADFRHKVKGEADDEYGLDGPADDDIESSFDPDEIEASRARELGLGVGARELELQRDVQGSGPATLDGGVERLSRDEIAAADSIADNDASDLGINEEFDNDDEEET